MGAAAAKIAWLERALHGCSLWLEDWVRPGATAPRQRAETLRTEALVVNHCGRCLPGRVACG
jgi:hypothetical protein